MHIIFLPALLLSSIHSMAAIPIVVACFRGYSRKIVRAFSNFAIYLFQEIAHVMREYRKAFNEHQGNVERTHTSRLRSRRTPRTPCRRITPAEGEGRPRGKRVNGGKA
jgi:hypothetical protein